MNDLKNKVAVVTGGGGGIGRAVAVRLAKEKAVVALLGGNDGQKLKTTAEMVEEAGAKCIVVGGDLTAEGFLRAGVEKIVAEAGGVDILVNNAGMAYNAKFEETGEEVFERIMRINVKVPYFLTQAALPYLRRSTYRRLWGTRDTRCRALTPLPNTRCWGLRSRLRRKYTGRGSACTRSVPGASIRTWSKSPVPTFRPKE